MTRLMVGEALEKSFAHRKVLKGVNVELNAGQISALMGKNGAGKTTLLRILAGLLRPDHGEVRFGENRLAEDVRGQLGVVLHSAMLYPDLTAFENLRFFGELYEVERVTERVQQVLEQVNLQNQRAQVVRTLSRGMTQRLAIARALLHNPSVLLLDEPFSGLDVDSSRTVEEILRDFRSNEGAVLYIAHDFDAVARLADQASILVAGKLTPALLLAGVSGDELRKHYQKICGGADA
ncbi:MAG: heme ABC exporter ATP-binding protein CcmA [Anaerolineaceae bacterium]|nr:heme ABC exporter ATP-binding protein CcmA [Anaerolineaceae bacterium]